MQIGRAADPAQLPAPVQFGGDGHGVGGLPTVVEIEDDHRDVLVRGPVEVTGLHALQDIGDGVLAEHHAAQHRLLGCHILGRLAPEVLAGRLVHTVMTEVVHDSH